MSTSLRRSVGSMATRKVIGWSLPSTLPTAAKPSSESARDTRSTLTVSTRSVSTRAPGPNSRAIEAATFAGGAAGLCAASRRSASASVTLELVADAEAQHLGLARAARAGEEEPPGSRKGPAPDGRLRARRPPIPECPADLHTRARPFEPPRDRRVREARLAALLASFPDPLSGRQAVGAEPVHHVHPIREPAATGNGADRAHADLAPGGGNHVVVEAGAVHAVEGRRLVGLVDDPHRRQHEPRAERDPVREAVVEVGLLERDFAPRLPPLDLRVLDLELGAERQAIIEAVREVSDEAGQVADGGGFGAGGVGVVHLAIATHRGALLRGEDLEGTGRHENKKAPPKQRPHDNSVARLVENGYQTKIAESKSRDSDGQAAIILVRTMSLVLVALVLLLAGGLGWGALHLQRRLERSERDRRPAAAELNPPPPWALPPQGASYLLAGPFPPHPLPW